MQNDRFSPNRREVLAGTAALAAGIAATVATGPSAAAQEGAAASVVKASDKAPNILYFLVDNLGMGELGCYGGGIIRGADTRRIDQFATQGIRLTNFAPEAQCTPSRSALMTGRYSIRSGNHTVALAGSEGGLVAWERTLGDVLSGSGYATAAFGKWHIGASEGRWPTDHGFDEWMGPPRTWDESLWPDDPWYDGKRDGITRLLESRKGQNGVSELDQLTLDVRRNVDADFLARADTFIRNAVSADKPFFVYFNHSMMHMPTIPRAPYQGASGNGDWADCLLELDGDFGTLLDLLDELGISDNTIVVFSGDNGPEEVEAWRGTPGAFDGSYFTGMEGSLRTPCMVRYPGRVKPGRLSNEIVHITDMFTTLLNWAGARVPDDRTIDGVDQRQFLEGATDKSAREGFLFWMGETLYGAKWGDFKLSFYEQRFLTDPALKLATPKVTNLIVDPKERRPLALPYLHSWTGVHFGRLLADFTASTQKEALIPAGAAVDFVPKGAGR